MAEKKETKTETSRERFLRLAPPRVDAALKKIAIVSNLTGSGYEWSPDEAKQILDALFDAVHDLKRKFERAKAPKGDAPIFTFASSSKTKSKAA
jgi:hypothetical protein